MDDRAAHTPSADIEPATVRELLLRTIEQPYLGNGSNWASAYPFSPFPGAERVVLRTESKDQLEKSLDGTSALTPVGRLVKDIHIGQPLMDFGSYTSVHPRQRDMSMNDIWVDVQIDLEKSMKDKSAACELARIAMMERVLALSSIRRGENPFIKILETAYKATHSGLRCDLAPSNIFLDEEKGTLELIDQLSEYHPLLTNRATQPLQEYTKQFYRLLGIFNQHSYYQGPEFETRETAAKQLCTLMKEANAYVLAAHANDKPGEYHGLAFADVSDVKAVSLDDPPRVLVERLNQLVARGNIPLR